MKQKKWPNNGDLTERWHVGIYGVFSIQYQLNTKGERANSQTITDGYIWISILSTTALLGASLLATAWKFTQSLVSVKETVEVID